MLDTFSEWSVKTNLVIDDVRKLGHSDKFDGSYRHFFNSIYRCFCWGRCTLKPVHRAKMWMSRLKVAYEANVSHLYHLNISQYCTESFSHYYVFIIYCKRGQWSSGIYLLTTKKNWIFNSHVSILTSRILLTILFHINDLVLCLQSGTQKAEPVGPVLRGRWAWPERPWHRHLQH